MGKCTGIHWWQTDYKHYRYVLVGCIPYKLFNTVLENGLRIYSWKFSGNVLKFKHSKDNPILFWSQETKSSVATHNQTAADIIKYAATHNTMININAHTCLILWRIMCSNIPPQRPQFKQRLKTPTLANIGHA